MEHFLTIDTQIYITCCTIANRSSHINTTPPMKCTSWFLNLWAMWKVIILCLHSNWHCTSWPKTHITYAQSCLLCLPRKCLNNHRVTTDLNLKMSSSFLLTQGQVIIHLAILDWSMQAQQLSWNHVAIINLFFIPFSILTCKYITYALVIITLINQNKIYHHHFLFCNTLSMQ